MLPIILGYSAGFAHEYRKINVAGASLLTGVTSQAGKKFPVEDQVIFRAQQGILNHRPG